MRILTVNNTADRYGASRCMERVFGALAERGHVVHAVLPEEGPLAPLLRARGIHVHVHPALPIVDRSAFRTTRGRLRFLRQLPLSTLFLARLIRREGIDLVHTNTVVMPSPSLAALLTRRPHVWHVRELLAEFGALWRPYQRWVYHLSSAVIAISHCVREQFSPTLRSRIHVVYDGLPPGAGDADPAAVAALRSPLGEGAVLIGVAGRIKWHRKGQEVLVRAAAHLQGRFPACRFLLAGSPAPGNEEHATRLCALIEQLGLGAVIRFVGELENTAPFFSALDIAVAPSVQPEPFGCVVIEAMASGTAVVGSRAGGIAEQIVHGASGLLFAPGDAEDLARQLEALLLDPALRLRLAANGRCRVQEHFGLQSTVEATLALFQACTPCPTPVAARAARETSPAAGHNVSPEMATLSHASMKSRL